VVKRVVETEVRANVGPYVAGMEKAEGATGKLAASQEKASKSTDQLQEKALSQSESWKTVSTGMLGAGTAAAAFGLALPTAKAASFEAAMAQVASTGPEARAAMESLSSAARASATDIDGAGYSAVQAAGGIEALLKAGVSVDDVMGGAMAGSLALAAAGQMDVAAAAEAASSAMTQFKLSGRDVPRIADLLAAGAGKAQGDVSDLTQALSQSGLVASQFGLGIDETVGSLAAFASAGLMGSDAGTSFRNMLLRLANPSGEAADEMERLGIAAYDAQGNFVGVSSLAQQLQDKMSGLDQKTRDAALATIFGSDAIRAANVLYEQGADGIDSWVAAVDEQGYAAEVASERLNSLNGDLQKLWGVLGEVGIAAGEANTGPLRDLVQVITDLLRVAAENPAMLQAVAIGVGAIGVAAAGLGVTMKVVTAVSEFRTALSKLDDASRKTADGIDGASKATGRWSSTLKTLGSVAIAGGILVFLGQLRNSLRATAEDFDGVKGAMEAGGLGNLDEIFKRADGTGLWESAAGDVNDLASALEILNSGIPKSTGIYREVAKQFDLIDQSLANMDTAEAQESFTLLADQMREQGMSTQDIIDRFPAYAETVRSVLRDASNEWITYSTAPEDVARIMAGDLPDGLVLTEEGILSVAEAAERGATSIGTMTEESQIAAEEAEALAEKLSAWADADAAFVGPTGAWDAVIAKNREVAEAAAESSTDAGDSWKDFYDGHTVAVEDYLAELEKQVEAQRSWEANMTILAGKVSQGTLDELARLGPEGAPLVAAAVNMSAEELARMEAAFGQGAAAATGEFASELDKAPAVWAALMGTAGEAAVASAQAELAAGKTTLQGIISRYNLKFAIDADMSPADRAVNAFIARTRGRSATVDIYTRTMNRNGLDAELADGAVLEFYRSGGLRENHVAQIAPAGTWRVWAEDETEGEGYIPLAKSKRPRSTAILREIADRFGYALVARANGSVDVPGYRPTPATPAAAPATSTVTYIYNMEGREAMRTLLDQTRDATRRHYQTEGVHG